MGCCESAPTIAGGQTRSKMHVERFDDTDNAFVANPTSEEEEDEEEGASSAADDDDDQQGIRRSPQHHRAEGEFVSPGRKNSAQQSSSPHRPEPVSSSPTRRTMPPIATDNYTGGGRYANSYVLPAKLRGVTEEEYAPQPEPQQQQQGGPATAHRVHLLGSPMTPNSLSPEEQPVDAALLQQEDERRKSSSAMKFFSPTTSLRHFSYSGESPAGGTMSRSGDSEFQCEEDPADEEALHEVIEQMLLHRRSSGGKEVEEPAEVTRQLQQRVLVSRARFASRKHLFHEENGLASKLSFEKEQSIDEWALAQSTRFDNEEFVPPTPHTGTPTSPCDTFGAEVLPESRATSQNSFSLLQSREANKAPHGRARILEEGHKEIGSQPNSHQGSRKASVVQQLPYETSGEEEPDQQHSQGPALAVGERTVQNPFLPSAIV